MFTFPVAALRMAGEPVPPVRRQDATCSRGTRAGSARKSYLGRPEPRFTPHGGCFSSVCQTVTRWPRSSAAAAAQVLLPPRDFHLAVVACLLGDNDQDWGETRLAFDEAIVQGGPDHFFSLKKGIEFAYGSLNPEQLLASLRFRGWDARILGGTAQVVIKAASSLEQRLRN